MVKGKRRFAKASGAQIGNRRIYVYRCDTCGVHHLRKKPEFYCNMNGCSCATFTKFDSVAEANRYAELLLLMAANMIAELKKQVPFVLLADGGAKVGKYIADFTYTKPDGSKIIEDVKGGAITDLAEWKLKHIKAQYGFDVLLTKR